MIRRIRPRAGLFAPALLLAACSNPAVPAAPPRVVAVAPATLQSAPAPTPSPASPPHDAVGDAARFLEDGWGKQELRRARLAEGGRLAWTLGAAEAGDFDVAVKPHPLNAVVIVVERHRRHMRVIHDAGSVRLAFYLEHDKFHEVTARNSLLLDDRGEPFANGCGATFKAGSRLQAAPAVGEFRRVEFSSSRLVLSGLLPRKQLGRIYEVPKAPTKPPPRDCYVQAPLHLRDAPSGGQPVAQLLGKGRQLCHALAPVAHGARRIAVYGGGATVVGFARSSAVTTRTTRLPMGYGTLPGSGWGMSHSTYLHLWPGDALFDPEGGGRIGRVLKRALRVAVRGSTKGTTTTVRLPVYPWSWLSFGITETTASAAKEKRLAWLQRARFSRLRVVGKGTKAGARKVLNSARQGLARCYDRALDRTPGRSFHYAVDVDFAAAKPAPKLRGTGPVDPSFERCLQTRLRQDDDDALQGTRLHFTLDLKPDPLVDRIPSP
jgi:hypothetical protein